MRRIKKIVFSGLKKGYARNNIIGQIKIMLTNKKIPEATNRAEILYTEYRREYYNRLIKQIF